MSRPGVALELASASRSRASTAGRPVGWLPLLVLPAGVLVFGRQLAPWALMWALSIAIYARPQVDELVAGSRNRRTCLPRSIAGLSRCLAGHGCAELPQPQAAGGQRVAGRAG